MENLPYIALSHINKSTYFYIKLSNAENYTLAFPQNKKTRSLFQETGLTFDHSTVSSFNWTKGTLVKC